MAGYTKLDLTNLELAHHLLLCNVFLQCPMVYFLKNMDLAQKDPMPQECMVE